MIRTAVIVGGFYGGLACIVAGSYLAFGWAGALIAAGPVLLLLSFAAFE